MVLGLTLEHDLLILLQLLRSRSKRIALVLFSSTWYCKQSKGTSYQNFFAFGSKNSLNPLEHQASLTERICCLVWTRSRLNCPTNCTRRSLPSFWYAIHLGYGFWSKTIGTQALQEGTYKLSKLFGIDFHNCAHGGQRDKLTRLWSNRSWGKTLELFCDKRHSHASWKPRNVNGRISFPTAEEAECPWLFCESVVQLVEKLAVQNGSKSTIICTSKSMQST